MDGEKDKFYFWMVEREESLSLSFPMGWLIVGELTLTTWVGVNSKQIIEVDRADGSDMV